MSVRHLAPLQTCRLGDLIEIKRGISWDKSMERDENDSTAVPVLRIPNVQETLQLDNLVYLSGVSAAHLDRFRAAQGWTILVASNGNPLRVGAPVFIDRDQGYLFASFLMGVAPRNTSALDPKFLYYFLNSPAVRRQVTDSVQGTTGLKNLQQRVLEGLELPLFSMAEQRRIAMILDTVDEAIRQAEAVIAKLKQLKAGLLHDLLTRGIDEHGHLRDPAAHPEQFKDSPLGRIPAEWTVGPLESLLVDRPNALRSGPFGSALLKEELASEGIPIIGIDNVFPEQFVSAYSRFITHEKYNELRRYRAFAGDVLITIMGTVGRSCVVPPNIPLAISSKHVWTMTVDPSIYLPNLLCAQLNYASWVLQHFASDAQGSMMDAIRSDTLRSTLLPVPPLCEQQWILDTLAATDAQRASELEYAAKLRCVKQGLVDDLLTGRVHVDAVAEVLA